VQQWSLTQIFAEYRLYSYPKSRSMDQQFIEAFAGLPDVSLNLTCVLLADPKLTLMDATGLERGGRALPAFVGAAVLNGDVIERPAAWWEGG
jgi:hypothetical protein